jgi:hypothetical protein
MIPKQLRFSDLKERNIVNNWVTLRNWIDNENFPPGKMVGPNTRIWSEPDVAAWLDSRPSTPKAAPRRRAAVA